MRPSLWNAPDIERLLEAENARDFLRMALEIREEKQQPLSYAALARGAGFSSRSFPRDVLLGQKSLTKDSAAAFGQALKLSSDLRDYFEALVEQNPKTLKSSKSRLQRRLGAEPARQADAFSVEHFSMVYASLGTTDEGASLAEIQARCGLPEADIERTLTELIRLQLVEFVGMKFRSRTSHLAMQSLAADGAFHRLYLKRLMLAKKVAEKRFKSDQMLFLESTFSVRKEKLPELKEELRQLLVRFVDSSEVAEGNDVVTLTSALFSLKENF